MCIPIDAPWLSKFFFIASATGQPIIVLATLDNLVHMFWHRRVRACQQVTYGFKFLIYGLFLNTLIIFGLVLGMVTFLGDGRNLVYTDKCYPFSASLGSFGTASCVASIFVSMLVGIWLGFLINYERNANKRPRGHASLRARSVSP